MDKLSWFQGSQISFLIQRQYSKLIHFFVSRYLLLANDLVLVDHAKINDIVVHIIEQLLCRDDETTRGIQFHLALS